MPDLTLITRREFLRTAGRWLVGGLLAGGVGYLVGRNGCDLQGQCGACPRLAGCGLPEATDYRGSHPEASSWQTNRKS